MSKAEEKIPLILDTDIGSDIDDAVCLAYLLRQPRCELLGVTTVSGEPQKRAALADAVCRAAGRKNVPIHSGCDKGINLGIVQPQCPQAAILDRFDHRKPDEFKPYTALEFLREQIRARPGEITLLTIGPLTNIGLLFTLDPEIPKLLKRIVLMCGVFTWTIEGHPREWNALCDPIATAITYRAPVAESISIGLDVTTKCQMPTDDSIARFKKIGGPLSVVAAATEVWKKHAGKVTFHDPLSATIIFKPEICEYQEGKVDVELKSDWVSGMTLFGTKGPEKQHRIAVTVKPEMFFEEYFGVTSGK